MNTDTPRTDALAKRLGRLAARYACRELTLKEYAELIDKEMNDARQLERELNEANEEIERLKNEKQSILET